MDEYFKPVSEDRTTVMASVAEVADMHLPQGGAALIPADASAQA